MKKLTITIHAETSENLVLGMAQIASMIKSGHNWSDTKRSDIKSKHKIEDIQEDT